MARGFEKPEVPMVGFTMYELSAGVGFIRRLMIDQRFQGKGYGRAAMLEVIRRLKLHPEVEMIATRHRRENEAAAKLYRSLGPVGFWGFQFFIGGTVICVSLPTVSPASPNRFSTATPSV